PDSDSDWRKTRRIYHVGLEWFMLRATMHALRFRIRLMLGAIAAALIFAAVDARAQQLDTVQIRPNVWVIFGAGGNVTVHLGEDGVILVDSGSEPMVDRTLDAVKAITKAPIRMIINTSADPDHVGGNDKVGAAGVAINPDNF